MTGELIIVGAILFFAVSILFMAVKLSAWHASKDSRAYDRKVQKIRSQEGY